MTCLSSILMWILKVTKMKMRVVRPTVRATKIKRHSSSSKVRITVPWCSSRVSPRTSKCHQQSRTQSQSKKHNPVKL